MMASSGNKVILVCSAGALFAQNVCEQLFTLKEKYTIRAADRSQERLDQLKKKMGKRSTDGTFETVVFDFNRPETIEHALKNVRRVVLYLPNSMQREHYARNVIDACRKLSPQPEQIVLISVIGAKQREVTLHKQYVSIEEHLRQSGLPFSILETALFQELITHCYADQIQRGELRLPVKDDGKFALVSLRELANGVARVMEDFSRHHGQTYSFTGPEIFLGKDVARLITETINKEVKFREDSIENNVSHLVSVGWTRDQAQQMVEYLHWMSNKGKMEHPSQDAHKLGVRTVSFKEIISMDREFLINGKNRNEPL
eukprot:TRINITY_DN555_c0_g1_i1.p2 TRINITY_DN555_c0_g1~~TRINITY_DN555_c0_g1_i1.p2  ORF type:complete len:315 (+),score=172.67 TRINITY_DN555_c0_g1_i1:86-1030(+)